MRLINRLLYGIACAFVVLVACVAYAQPSPPTLTVHENHVTASGFPPNSTIIIYGVTLAADGYSTSTKVRFARLADDDRDGSVTFDYPGVLPFRSVWIAVNETNGDYVIGSPAGYHWTPGPAASFRRHGATVDEIRWRGRFSYLLYVHPENGAWIANAIDGRDDADGLRDYVTSIALATLKPVQVENTKKPTELKPGGTLFIINGEDLQILALKLDGATLNGVR
jgi:hypothetical protein